MTTNQTKAVALAGAVVAEGGRRVETDDAGWHLLRLAAGLNDLRAAPAKVARRVLEQAECRAAYVVVVGGRARAVGRLRERRPRQAQWIGTGRRIVPGVPALCG